MTQSGACQAIDAIIKAGSQTTPNLADFQAFVTAIVTQADGAIKTQVRWSVAMKRAKLKGMAERPLKQLTQALEKVKAQIRARVEHPFHVVKNLFNHKKTRYRGLAKNGAQYDTLFALGNLVIAKKALLQSMENSVCEAA